MMHRAICVTGDPLLRRTLQRTLAATGSVVEFADSTEGLGALEVDLVVLDPQSRREVDPAELERRLGGRGHVVVVGESPAEDDILELLRGAPFNHVISQVDEPDELVVTSVKLRRGDIFGLEKYLAWGVLVNDSLVTCYDDKRRVIQEVADYAASAGVRRPVVARIESVADELLMNALYDAPALRSGEKPRIAERSRIGDKPLACEPALARYTCDGRYFALSVRDNYGELRKEAILDNLVRARADKGMPQMRDLDGGAGLGLYFIIASVTRFIANIRPGEATEIICLFDLRPSARRDEGCKALHIFSTA